MNHAANLYLKLGLSVVLVFVVIRMILADIYKIPRSLSMAVVASILTVSIVASLVHARRLTELKETSAYSD